jgi:DNA-binding Lrp family transcriptional regulator
MSVLREVQRLPLTTRPFQEIAERLGMDEREVLEITSGLLEKGIIRRIGISVAHRKLGMVANPMTVLNVPEDRLDEIGQRIGDEPEVTHCYSRKGWDYNIFFMTHSKTREEAVAKVDRIMATTGISDYRLLFSTKELKKVPFEIRDTKEVSK